LRQIKLEFLSTEFQLAFWTWVGTLIIVYIIVINWRF